MIPYIPAACRIASTLTRGMPQIAASTARLSYARCLRSSAEIVAPRATPTKTMTALAMAEHCRMILHLVSRFISHFPFPKNRLPILLHVDDCLAALFGFVPCLVELERLDSDRLKGRLVFAYLAILRLLKPGRVRPAGLIYRGKPATSLSRCDCRRSSRRAEATCRISARRDQPPVLRSGEKSSFCSALISRWRAGSRAANVSDAMDLSAPIGSNRCSQASRREYVLPAPRAARNRRKAQASDCK